MPQVTYNNPELKESYPGSTVTLSHGFGPIPQDNKSIFYFDIDDTLYDKSLNVLGLSSGRIIQFIQEHLNLPYDEAVSLNVEYYTKFGLSVDGLATYNNIDPMVYNSYVDDKLPLHGLIKPNPELRRMLINLKKSGKIERLWVLTNAYKNHALRVLTLLGIGDLFDGLTYCDFNKVPIIGKPKTEYYQYALGQSGVNFQELEKLDIFYADDSELNVKAAKTLGFKYIVHIVELDEDYEKLINSNDYEIYYTGDNHIKIARKVTDIHTVFPHLFEIEESLLVH